MTNDDAIRGDSPELPKDLAALYVAGAMTSEERNTFESRLNVDAELRAALSSFDEVGELLLAGIEPVQPDPKTLQSLLARIESDVERIEPAPLICRAGTDDWQETDMPGVTLRVLHADQENKRMTALMRMEPGAAYPSHVHGQAEECLVLEGDLDFGDYVLNVGDYLRLEPGTKHGEARTEHGCLCLITAELPDAMVA